MPVKKKIGIIDYSIGNLFSVFQACIKVGLDPFYVKNTSELKKADGIILPGVGAFQQGMKTLKALGFEEGLSEYIKTGKPFMGICLGMQLLLDKSEEFGDCQGLGIVKGTVESLRNLNDNQEFSIPKITWSEIYKGSTSWDKTPLEFIKDGTDFYFVHSFYCNVENPNKILCLSQFGKEKYCAGIIQDNIFAVQFHPEKSGEEGIKIYNTWKNNF